MENNKKQQNFSRPPNSKTSQSADSKQQKTDLQNSKQAFPRVAKRRDNQSIASRNDSQRSSKQLPGKQQQQRSYVDKRPRARGGGGNATSSNLYVAERGIDGLASSDLSIACTRLVDEEVTDEIAGACNISQQSIGVFDDRKNQKLRNSKESGKRQNLNHLLNFQYVSREHGDCLGGGGGGGAYGVFGSYGSGAIGKKHQQQQHKYNKEQFLQANFQFVIKASAKPHLMTSPDTIIDWALIEQINIQTTEEPRCPICLYPPVAAKLTRCGHAYCWPCILHYLALNDKSWRKCPICYEAIHVADLKSTAILQQIQFNVGDEISFQLMRRKKGSLFIEKFSKSDAVPVERYPQYSSSNDLKSFSKFLIAKRSDILNIIERERAELMADEDTTCPEYVFVQQALNLLNERLEHLGDVQQHCKDEEDVVEKDNLNDEMVECNGDFNDHQLGAATNDENFHKTAENGTSYNEVNSNVNLELEDRNDEAGAEAEAEVDTLTFENHDDTNAFNTLIVSNIGGINTVQQQKYYFFYQSLDGQNVFLHPLNVKMLQACYGSLEYAPLTINARILQKECHTMNDDLRRKFTCLGHLPLTCQFAVVEVELKEPIVSSDIISQFKDGIRQRRLERERREREEKKREKKIAAINDRQMGKLISKTANINLSSALEFPTCGFDYDLIPATRSQGNSFSALKTNDVKPVETSVTSVAAAAAAAAVSVAGTPPGPSYSSIIMSNEGVKVDNSLLFPELSIQNKGTKKKNTLTVTAGTIKTANLTPNKQFENDIGGDIFTDMHMGTTFGDVMEHAMVRKKTSTNNTIETMAREPNSMNNASASAGKKQKREKKKMVPLI